MILAGTFQVRSSHSAIRPIPVYLCCSSILNLSEIIESYDESHANTDLDRRCTGWLKANTTSMSTEGQCMMVDCYAIWITRNADMCRIPISRCMICVIPKVFAMYGHKTKQKLLFRFMKAMTLREYFRSSHSAIPVYLCCSSILNLSEIIESYDESPTNTDLGRRCTGWLKANTTSMSTEGQRMMLDNHVSWITRNAYMNMPFLLYDIWFVLYQKYICHV